MAPFLWRESHGIPIGLIEVVVLFGLERDDQVEMWQSAEKAIC
jgi:hypothetical protein